MKVKIERPDQNTLKKMNIDKWNDWECDVSEFDWYYDETEKAYVLEGEVEVITDEGKFLIKKGDLVTFEKGLKCRWKVLKKIKKKYSF